MRLMPATAAIALALIALMVVSGCTEGTTPPAHSSRCGNMECESGETDINPDTGLMNCWQDCGTACEDSDGVDFFSRGTATDASGAGIEDSCTEHINTEGMCHNNVVYAIQSECLSGCSWRWQGFNRVGYRCKGEGRLITPTNYCFFHDPTVGPPTDPNSNYFLELGESMCHPKINDELWECGQGPSGPEFRLVKKCDTGQCHDGRCINPCVNTDTVFAPQDTPCETAWPQSEGSDYPQRLGGEQSFNSALKSCATFGVCDPNLDYIVQDAEDCCNNLGSDFPQLCEYALVEGNGIPKRCKGLYLIKGLGNYAVYMQGYFYPELCCSGSESWCPESSYIGTCSSGPEDSDKYTANALSLPCPGTQVWNSDTDMSKNTCWIPDLPAHASLNIVKTGTCGDYSIALTTLLRKAGYEADEVMRVSGFWHVYNLVKLEGDSKYHYVDTTGNRMGIIIGSLPPAKEQAGEAHPYCGMTGTTSSFNDTGHVTKPTNDQIFGCDGTA